jgi:hypothetical protein
MVILSIMRNNSCLCSAIIESIRSSSFMAQQ